MFTKLRVLYSDSEMASRNQVKDYFCGRTEFDKFDIVSQPDQLMNKINENNYDVIVLDLGVVQTNWVQTIDYLNHLPHKPYLIVTLGLTSEIIIQNLLQQGVQYFLVKPFGLDSLYMQIQQAYNYFLSNYEIQKIAERNNETDDLRVQVQILLQEAGISVKTLGYQYLVEAILFTYEDRTCINMVTKKLYPLVANVFQVDSSKVERAIRQSIENTWEKNGYQCKMRSFMPSASHQYDKPSNSEFIGLVVDQLFMNQWERSSPFFSHEKNKKNDMELDIYI